MAVDSGEHIRYGIVAGGGVREEAHDHVVDEQGSSRVAAHAAAWCLGADHL